MEESTRSPPRLIKMDSTDRNVLERSKIWLLYKALILGVQTDIPNLQLTQGQDKSSGKFTDAQF